MIASCARTSYLTSRSRHEAQQTPIADQIILELRSFGPDILVFDTGSHIRGGAENDNDDVTRLFVTLKYICKELGCSIVVIHHTGKNKSKAKGRESLRGATAYYDSARAVHELALYENTAELARLGIPPSEQERYLTLINSKSNYGPLAKPLTLRRDEYGLFEIVDLTATRALERSNRDIRIKSQILALLEAEAPKTFYSYTKFAKLYGKVDSQFGLNEKELRKVLTSMVGTYITLERMDGQRGRVMKPISISKGV